MLNDIKGPCEWEEQSAFTLTVKVAGNIFTGKGRTKKEAKKAAAVTALSSLYSDYLNLRLLSEIDVHYL